MSEVTPLTPGPSPTQAGRVESATTRRNPQPPAQPHPRRSSPGATSPLASSPIQPHPLTPSPWGEGEKQGATSPPAPSLWGQVPLRDLRGVITVEPPERSFWQSASCAASSRRSLLILVLGLLILLAASLTQAQDGGAAITDDQVNAIASRMFCPVCENEPLDVCMTAACARWREDIRGQLAAGRTEDQIIADFVARYGERASATPLDPTLRGLSVYVPWLIAGVVLLGGGWVFWRWRIARRPLPVVPPAGQPAVDDPDEAAYRATLERDLKD